MAKKFKDLSKPFKYFFGTYSIPGKFYHIMLNSSGIIWKWFSHHSHDNSKNRNSRTFKTFFHQIPKLSRLRLVFKNFPGPEKIASLVQELGAVTFLWWNQQPVGLTVTKKNVDTSLARQQLYLSHSELTQWLKRLSVLLSRMSLKSPYILITRLSRKKLLGYHNNNLSVVKQLLLLLQISTKFQPTASPCPIQWQTMYATIKNIHTGLKYDNQLLHFPWLYST